MPRGRKGDKGRGDGLIQAVSRAAPEQTTAERPDLEEVVAKIEAFVEDMVVRAEDGAPAPDVKECLHMALDVGEWMRQVRLKSVVHGSLYVPRAVKALGEKAAAGDVASAKLLFDYLNLMPGDRKASGAVAAVQVNVSAPTLKELLVREGVEI